MNVHFSSKTAEHYTPRVVIDAVLRVLGDIALDPCAEDAKAAVPAQTHFTRADDGLSLPWFGTVYMNPPYGRDLPRWVTKLVEEYRSGRVQEAIALLPCRPDTAWCRALRDYPRCEVRGRLRFGDAPTPAPFPSMLVYLGVRWRVFAEAMAPLGDVWERRA